MADKIIISIDGVHREPTASELEYLTLAREQIQADFDASQELAKAKLAAKNSAQSKLKTLGLTDDEIAALVG